MSYPSRSANHLLLMKPKFFLNFLLLGLLSTLSPAAVTVTWGSLDFTQILDSHGAPLDSSYVFQLGVFSSTYTPVVNDIANWSSHWQVFDQADYQTLDASGTTWATFGSEAILNNNGTTSSTAATAAQGFDFRGLNAYLWIHSPDATVLGDQNLLVRASGSTLGSTDWQFPTTVADCCGANLPLQWSVSDLTPTDVPVVGYQKGADPQAPVVGEGKAELPSHTPESFLELAVVPEPCSAVMMLVLGMLAMLDRRRSWIG